MRFYEFNKSDTDLESALINVLLNMKGDADEKDQATDISMDAVKQIMSNTGYPAFNYDVFKKIYDHHKRQRILLEVLQLILIFSFSEILRIILYPLQWFVSLHK